MNTKLKRTQPAPAPSQQGFVPSQQGAVSSPPRPKSFSPASPSVAKAILNHLDKGVVTGKRTKTSNPAILPLAPPAPHQGPLARLPLEVGARIFSYLGEESLSARLRLRTVSRGFAHASRAGQPALDDKIASGYLRRILRQKGMVNAGQLEPFFVRHAPKMRHIDLAGSYKVHHIRKTALLVRLLSERQTSIQTLNLRNCPGLRQLPEGLSVGGLLDLSGTKITQLPEGLSVGGDLDLSDTSVKRLSQGLSVGGWLDLRGTRITQLPAGLSVGGRLDLRGTRITQLPAGLGVGGSLDLRYSYITQLPPGLCVGGFLDICDTRITRLPDDLKFGGLCCRTSSS